MQNWVAWMKELGEKGYLKDIGNPLEPGGKVVKGKQKSITDGPYAESKDIVGGYIADRGQRSGAGMPAELSKGLPDFRRRRHGGSAAHTEKMDM